MSKEIVKFIVDHGWISNLILVISCVILLFSLKQQSSLLQKYQENFKLQGQAVNFMVSDLRTVNNEETRRILDKYVPNK